MELGCVGAASPMENIWRYQCQEPMCGVNLARNKFIVTLTYLHRTFKFAKKKEWVGRLPGFHDIYRRNEGAMAEGNPMMALLRGQYLETPSAVWLRGTPDIVHEYLDPESGKTNEEPERFCDL